MDLLRLTLPLLVVLGVVLDAQYLAAVDGQLNHPNTRSFLMAD